MHTQTRNVARRHDLCPARAANMLKWLPDNLKNIKRVTVQHKWHVPLTMQLAPQVATRGPACMCQCDTNWSSYPCLFDKRIFPSLFSVFVCVFVCCVLPASFGWKLSLSLSNRIERTPAANAACCHQVVHLKQRWSDCQGLLINGASRGRAELPRVPSAVALFTGKCFSFYLVSTLISHSEFGVTLDRDLEGNVKCNFIDRKWGFGCD